MNHKEMEDIFGFDVYPKRDIVLVRGKDARLWDEQGKEYIDCMAGIGVANIGNCNEKVAQAVREQAEKLITCYGMFYNDVRAELMKKLVEISPASLEKAFLCNTGAEAVESAIKFARFTTGKKKFICAMRGFHGRTMGALSATFNPKYKEGFVPLLPGFSFVPFDDFEKLEEEADSDTAGVILEIVQGEGGINVGSREYFRNVMKLCREKEILLVVDEVQTGFCRTGRMFACEHYGIEPDIMCIAKAMAGGIPLGATLCSSRIKVPKGKHGTTFGGNPLSCAAGLAAIDFMIENNLAGEAEEKGRFLMEKLMNADLSKVREIRGLGLMIGIELKEKAAPYTEKLMEKGILVMQAGTTVLRLLPPLVISKEELETAANVLIDVLS